MTPKWFFGWLLLLNCFVYAAVWLVIVKLTMGFDTMFPNPFILGYAYVLQTTILYIPFFVLFRFVFEYVMKRRDGLNSNVLAGWLFGVLVLITVGMSLTFSGGQASLLNNLLLVALNVFDVALFLLCRRPAIEHGQVV
ncbi:hypothetical protein [Agromyces sp. ZXT2-6]|uniref:hypothetical protein n=1 Tax=Agromyces sp. ZXT2-6 TaxID=3461153 RepID=UPI004054C4BE